MNLTDEILTRHNRELRERCEELEERIRQLEGMMAERVSDLSWMYEYTARPMCVRLLEYLVLREVATHDGAMDWLYGGRENPGPEILKVFAYHLRIALKAAFPDGGGMIVSRHGIGYSLTPHARRLISAMSVDKSDLAA